MGRVASDSVLKGIAIEEAVNEKNLSARGLFKYGVIGVVFKDDFSYHLRFQSYSVISPVDAFEHIDTCYDVSSPYCKIPLYWYEGFLSIQSSIDAAVIEMKTNRSVWEEMKSISGIRLQSPLIKSIYKVNYIWFSIYSMLCFSPYMYFLSVKVIREKKKLKVLMKAMGLQDIAFWLSWSLLYTVYIAITSSLLAAITVGEVTQDCSFSEIYFLYFFYGIASVSLLFSLLKQPHITSFVGFFLHIVFGSLGFMTLFEQVPPSLEWVFNLFSPYTFTAAQLYPFSNLYSMLILDSILYLLLAIYFDKILPGKYGVPYPPLFFLRPSYWLQQGSKCNTQPDPIPVPGCDTEPMPEGFERKEAIRLYNIRKIYERKGKRTEALRGLSFNIYEGQITALLGLSGSGKTALLNVLSGFSKPSAGSAVIYNYRVSEVQDMEGIQAMVGICPQLNLHFEALTVKENLRIFAHIKKIRWKEVEQEVQKVLVQLDLTDLQDVHADSLSGGQKRKLSLAIAILGDPQVLLLDEPMVGLDPCSRHQVWELLAERRAGRVTLICTQSVEEADACADRKAFLSNGRLQCVGSSLYLKRKWGIGYHLRMCINDQCDPGLASSLVRRYIPSAVLKGRDGDELCYMLPLESTKSFPDLLGHLDNGLLLGVVHYEVSRTTLADALLKLEGKEDIDHKGKLIVDNDVCRDERAENLKESGQNFLGFSEPAHIAASGMQLWRQQVLAVARVRGVGMAFSTLLNLLFLPFPSQTKARAQLRVSGLFPSAYWCGQALVDVPLFWALMCLMFIVVLLFNRICPMEAFIILPMVAIGYGVSLIFLVYLIAFMFRKGRTNRYLWSFVFVLVSGGNLHSVTFDNTSCHLRFHFECVKIQQNNPDQADEMFHESFYSCLVCLQESVIIVNGLRKEYEDKRACSIFKKKKKVAVKNLSFCVKKGEVLGLLGPNGAGKSTTIRMISGDIAVTAGEVLLQGCRAVVLGCCPQEDPLWLDLTVLQHLEAYAAVRGVRGEDAAVLISRYAAKGFLFLLSGGIGQEKGFLILGSPTVMLWDEPSAGMDVAGQKAMQAAVRSKECAAVLSTHCLEEAAMCDRVAVLVAGQLRYIGSPEELRRKFGTSYILEVKPKDVGQSDALHSEILHLFPGAARQKRISSLLTYKIPMEDALPLSQAFSKLEAAKQNSRLEEYSLSLHTLQQVFMDFGEELEEPDLEGAAEGAAEQRLLQP
uniref:ABC transporter domain-containing protein n=1 Tax=Meleagris gallopavo TaxID=9103 RepID=A0A803XUI2_MELGA